MNAPERSKSARHLSPVDMPARWQRSKPLLRREQLRPQIHPDPEQHRKFIEMQSFSQLLQPRSDFGQDIGLRDLNSTGALFDVVPLSSEARPRQQLAEAQSKLLQALTTVFPEREKDPWLAQFFIYDDSSMFGLMTQLRRYSEQHGIADQYTDSWLRVQAEHLAEAAADSGVFRDDDGKIWRARQRRLRLCVWRRMAPGESVDLVDSMPSVLERLVSALNQADVQLKRLEAAEMHAWLTWWFGSTEERSSAAGPQQDAWDPRLASADLGRSALRSVAPVTTSDGCWWFHDRPSRFITIDEPTRVPHIGHFTADRRIGDAHETLWDRMPPGSVWSMTVAFVDQDEVSDHIKRVRHHSIGADPAVIARRKLADQALDAQAANQPLWRVFAGVFVTAPDAVEMDRRISKTVATLTAHGLRPILPQHDPLAHDSFIRALPFGFSYEQDRRWYARRARLWHADHAVRMTPFLGRSVGTRNPGILQFNRGAEPLAFDPLHELDRRKNAHSLILGPTGSGKTSLLIYELMHLLAMRRPRLYLITALPTFGLLANWCAQEGLSVVRRSIGTDDDVTLPPFAAASLLKTDEVSSAQDPLGEMEILARLMITGGAPADERKLRRHDIDLIRSAIEHAADNTPDECQTLTEDVVAALNEAARGQLGEQRIPKPRRQTAANMAGAMHLFCTGANGAIFNRAGEAWPEADITVIELGYFARKGYEDRLALAVTSLMRSIQDLVEAKQYSDRQTVVVIDEAHVLLQNPLVSPYLARIVATWRTFGAWLWIATQNLRQFPDSAAELLDQPEWWRIMAVDADEIEQIGRFRSLSAEQRAMILSAQKAPGRYTEGAVLSGTLLNLFRSVPPPLALALAQTEKHEKAERYNIMVKTGGSELDAAIEMAGKIRAQRKQA